MQRAIASPLRRDDAERSGETLERPESAFLAHEVDQADHRLRLLLERRVRIFASGTGPVVGQIPLPRIVRGIERRPAQRQLEPGEESDRGVVVHLVLGIGCHLSCVGDPQGHADHEDGHERRRDEDEHRADAPFRRLPIPLPVLDPHDRRIGNRPPDLYGRPRWP